jgi:hypothetical protein
MAMSTETKEGCRWQRQCVSAPAGGTIEAAVTDDGSLRNVAGAGGVLAAGDSSTFMAMSSETKEG